MAPEDRLKDLIIRFKEVLDSNEGRLNCFCKYGVQLEGWLKGEVLYFLDNEKSAGRIADFYREVPTGVGRKKADLKIRISTSSGLKHWLIGYRRGVRYDAQFYFGDPSSVGIKPDAEKLSEIPNGSKFLLILTTANPGIDDWSTGVDKFNRKFSPLHVRSLTNPADFLSFYYLGLLEVTRHENA